MPDNAIYGWSTTAGSNSDTADSTAGMEEGIFAALVNNRYRGGLARIRAWLQTLGGAATSGGGSNNYTLTSPSGHALTAYVDGLTVGFQANHTNSGAATLNVDGLGAIDLRTPDGAAIPASAITNGGRYIATYNSGATVFQLVSPILTSSAIDGGAAAAAIFGAV